ncbi:MAG: EF-hand domain-containing protein [Deltaproteobacteria bacterium]|nr:EF-hand domain-containing protein [Deltaproteobacteria bacterium]
MDREELADIFAHFDTDKNRRIDRDEFRRLVQDGLGAAMSDAEIAVGFKSIDCDSNGTIEFEEFVLWWEQR